MRIMESKDNKLVQSPSYNYIFDKTSGTFIRWGTTTLDDPPFSPYGPEILDLEISSGKCSGNCLFCYKKNGVNEPEVHMTFEQFKTILDKIPKNLTQIAFGVCDAHSNPDMFKMMRYAREHGVIPNVTFNGLDVTPIVAKLAGRICGAVAVSIVNTEKTYNAIKLLTDEIDKPGNTLRQVNIHYMLAEETFERAFQIIQDIVHDPRLKKLNAIVWLQYKAKGRHPDAFHVISSVDKYKKLVQFCEAAKVGFGFDSCSAPLFFKTIEGRENESLMIAVAEPCEAFGMFSSYINYLGTYFPCSFCEGEQGWESGIDVLHCEDFLKDVWFSEKVNHWREIITNSSNQCDCKFSKMCRSCPVFDVTACKTQTGILNKNLILVLLVLIIAFLLLFIVY
jgi:hypothetical protein